MRSDLVETFKIINGKYDINLELVFGLDEGGRRGYEYTTKNCLRKDLDYDVRKMYFF